MNLVALIYCEVMTGSREWIVIPELCEWAEGCPGTLLRGSGIDSLFRDFDGQAGHSWVEVGSDRHPRCRLTERIALCDVMPISKFPTLQLSDKHEHCPLGLDWVDEKHGSKSCCPVLDIVTGMDRSVSWADDGGQVLQERGQYCGASSCELFLERLEAAREIVDKWDEKELAETMARWCREWLRFGAWFRKTYPDHEPPPRSSSVDEIIEVLDAPRLEIWNRHDLGQHFKKKAVQP